MNTGDTLTDSRKHTWQVGQPLGRGLWGASWVVRDDDGNEAVLKTSLRAGDMPADAPLPDGLLEACAACVREQATLYRQAEHGFLPKLEDTFDLPDGRPALLLPRYASSLERRLDAGLPLGEALSLVERVSAQLEALSTVDRMHGDLRPSNVLLNERGDPVLVDLLTPAAVAIRGRLHELATDRRDYWPPEAGGTPSPGWDTWALCLVLYETAMLATEGGDPRRDERPGLPRDGLSKMQLATLRDRALARLKREGANPRFASQVATRLGALLNRGLSAQTEPSPPYRFQASGDLRPRVAEVAALVRPRIDSVGKLLLSADASDEVFEGGDQVAFSVTVGATEGVSDHEHIACGVQVLDLDAADDEDPRVHVPDARYDVQRHPSGRMRFQFALPDLPPGRYRAKVAFAIRDSGDEPELAEGEFEVRPPPGWVPPADEPEAEGSAPISLEERRRERDDEAPAAPVGPAPPSTSPGSEPGVEDADRFPTPVAPSSAADTGLEAGSSETPSSPPMRVEVEHEPTVAELPSMDPPSVPSDNGGSGPAWSTSDPGTPPPLQVRPSADADATPEAPPARDAGPGNWETDLPAPDDDLEGEPWVPGPAEGEDLPDWSEGDEAGSGFDLNAFAERAFEIIRRDLYAFFLVALAGLLGVLLVLWMIARYLFF